MADLPSGKALTTFVLLLISFVILSGWLLILFFVNIIYLEYCYKTILYLYPKWDMCFA
ncbi:hypothetical protein LEP1GSC061_1210 [Leptospira wolffii serovar Khorat str. Khorat-H2]|nr:hypothetical protein LEP1GSC061_1210 [Leptospira wolffii serovar Khorat str. Khorat-H2]